MSNITSINLNQDINGIFNLRYESKDIGVSYKPLPSHVGQGNSPEEQIQRKAYWHNTCIMDHKPSAMNKSELDNFWRQICKKGLNEKFSLWNPEVYNIAHS